MHKHKRPPASSYFTCSRRSEETSLDFLSDINCACSSRFSSGFAQEGGLLADYLVSRLRFFFFLEPCGLWHATTISRHIPIHPSGSFIRLICGAWIRWWISKGSSSAEVRVPYHLCKRQQKAKRKNEEDRSFFFSLDLKGELRFTSYDYQCKWSKTKSSMGPLLGEHTHWETFCQLIAHV